MVGHVTTGGQVGQGGGVGQVVCGGGGHVTVGGQVGGGGVGGHVTVGGQVIGGGHVSVGMVVTSEEGEKVQVTKTQSS